MFDQTSNKLAGLYLLVIMGISLFFSIAIYQLSIQEFDRSFRRPVPTFDIPNATSEDVRNLREQIINDRTKQYNEGKNRIFARLLLTNITILVGGGFLSYYLAIRTLRPVKEAHEAQSRFTADASHELRTPLAVMQTEIEVSLMDPKLNINKAKKQLASNLEELARLTALSDGLLKLSKLDNDELTMKKVSVTSLINDSTQQIKNLAKQKNVKVKKLKSEKLNVLGNKASLTEAIVIILDNAIKYSAPGSDIIIEVEKLNKSVRIKITDHGIGMTKSEQENIFERFYRADTARSNQQTSGYGLGLSIAKNIIDSHSGSITVKSRPGEGSTFMLTIPLL